MKTRAIILYSLVLLVPTLGAGLFMLHLLKNEGGRLAMAEAAALQDKARVMADEIALSVDEAKEGLMASLRALPPADLVASLREWERANPLIRNGFIWDAARKQLLLPDERSGITGEQAGFLRRYGDLFAGRAPWPAAPQTDSQQQLASTRQQLRAMSKADYNVKSKMPAPAPAEPETGWLAWHWEDELHLLGWLREGDGRRVRGVEIEMSALLSRIASGFAEKPAGRNVFALLDGNGRVFVQRGAAEITQDLKPRASAPLSPQLPHWQVAVYGPASAAAGRGYALVSGLLAAVFVVAILTGGALLILNACRNQRDAQQRTSFVSNVSHELKTPLTTIRMYAEMLAEGRVATEEKRRGYLETITRESQRLTRLVNNVLDFGRLEQGRKKYQAERLDLAAVAREVLDSQADRLREAGLQLATEFPAGPAFARLDRDALSQCLLNLVDNAIKYAGAGCRLVVRLAEGGGREAAARTWRFEIEDSGPGVPAAHREKLFEQFHRVDDSLTAKVAGFGLGLSISRRLLRDQGGELVYESAPAGGARFVVMLPADT